MRGGSTAGCAATGRFCGGCFRSCRRARASTRNRLPVIARWKILDNLRRSVLPPATVLLLVLGLDGAARLARSRGPPPLWRPSLFPMPGGHAGSAARAGADGNRGAASCARRPTTSKRTRRAPDCSSPSWRTTRGDRLHAIVVTLVRLGVTRRSLLEWETTAASAARAGAVRLRAFIAGMRASPLLALATFIAVAVAASAGAPRCRADPRALGRRAVDRICPQPAGAATRTRRHRQRTAPTCTSRAEDLGVLRGVRRRRGPLPAARQRPGQRGADRSPIARRRPTSASVSWRRWPRTTCTSSTRRARSSGSIARSPTDRAARALRRPPAELVRHADAGAACCRLMSPRWTAATWRVRSSRCRSASATLAPASRGARHGALRRDELRIPVRCQAPAVRDRLPPCRRRRHRPARCVVLRPPRVRSAPGQLHRHRQRRRAGDALVSPRTLDHDRARRPRPALVERDAVRVPDADAGDADATRTRCSTTRAGSSFAARWTMPPRMVCPWGISESAYNLVDRHGNYQYKAFGIPGLGLKRGLGDELVVAPYATALRVMIDPAASTANLRRLAAVGLARRLRVLRRHRLHASRLGRRRRDDDGRCPAAASSSRPILRITRG